MRGLAIFFDQYAVGSRPNGLIFHLGIMGKVIFDGYFFEWKTELVQGTRFFSVAISLPVFGLGS